MRNMARLTVLLAVTTAPLAAQGLARDELPIRSWSEEMRDKAETSLYERHDCSSALVQANAAYDRAIRHPERMDPRIPLVKARAHDCLGQLPAAIAAYGLHDQLAGLEPSHDPGFLGACTELAGDEMDVEDVASRDSLRAVLAGRAAAARTAIRQAAWQQEPQAYPPGTAVPVHPPAVGIVLDGTTMSTQELITLWPMYIRAWSDLPARTPLGNRTTEHARRAAGIAKLSQVEADAQARLLCLAVLP